MFSYLIPDKNTLLQFDEFLVLGGGISGESAGKLLKKYGKNVRLADSAYPKDQNNVFSEIISDKDTKLALEKTQVIIKSPGVLPDHPILLEANKRNITVISEIYLGRLFFQGTLIGITGTDGKSTTTALTHHIIKTQFPKSQVGGNLGLAFTSFCDEDLDLVVLELSSYQLDDSPNLHLTSSCIITLAPDHLERHKTMESYALAKWKILDHQNPNHICITQTSVLSQLPNHRTPFKGKMILFGENQDIKIASESKIITTEKNSYDTNSFQLPGFHNLQNLAVAIGLSETVGVLRENIQKAIPTFTGLPHRFQKINQTNWKNKSYKEVQFINDSKSTNFHSMLSGISGYSNATKLYLILGGEPKKENLYPFFDRIKGLDAEILIYGKAREYWKEDFEIQKEIKADFVNTIEDAVIHIKERLKPDKNICVILSPACASFDQYKNFSERGDHFVSLIETHFGT
ncbi:MAG: UDP-N-acetylmuramoyl-L-alanine--D-glutamate ligase [Leptospira sp.]|nr:UDP-N-acetylmuramoyl-L-alanine--D-glutamate ligase [Leptospira sp.]